VARLLLSHTRIGLVGMKYAKGTDNNNKKTNKLNLAIEASAIIVRSLSIVR
jgi:hypothetical protein